MHPCATHPAGIFRWLALIRPPVHHGRRQKTVRQRMEAFCVVRNASVQVAEPREFTHGHNPAGA
jgi:acetoin utilization deacetylase AcuC-like enzyme